MSKASILRKIVPSVNPFPHSEAIALDDAYECCQATMLTFERNIRGVIGGILDAILKPVHKGASLALVPSTLGGAIGGSAARSWTVALVGPSEITIPAGPLVGQVAPAILEALPLGAVVLVGAKTLEGLAASTAALTATSEILRGVNKATETMKKALPCSGCLEHYAFQQDNEREEQTRLINLRVGKLHRSGKKTKKKQNQKG